MDVFGARLYVITTLLLWCMDCKLLLAQEITCYCNTPYCKERDVSRCTSHLGKCFSQQTINTQEPDIHGCAEQLEKDEQASCLGAGDVLTRKQGSDYTLMCCKGDTCNYAEGVLDLDIYIETGNDSVLTDSASKNGQNKRYGSTNQSSDVYYSSKELWFKAAVIAVPIAGGFILIMLVLLAVRMLRRDSQRHRDFKHHQSLAKAQLYVADHFYNNPNNKLLHTYVACDDNGKSKQLKECLYTCNTDAQSCVHTAVTTDSHSLPGINEKGICSEMSPSHSGTQQAVHNSHEAETPSQKYPYEKLQDSTRLLENPQESVVMVWQDVNQSNKKPIDVV